MEVLLNSYDDVAKSMRELNIQKAYSELLHSAKDVAKYLIKFQETFEGTHGETPEAEQKQKLSLIDTYSLRIVYATSVIVEAYQLDRSLLDLHVLDRDADVTKPHEQHRTHTRVQPEQQQAAARLLISVVESVFLPSPLVIQQHKAALSGTLSGMMVLGYILRGYARAAMETSRVPHAAARVATYLRRAILGLQTEPAALTVAHATLMHVCHAGRHPAPALAVLQQSLYTVGELHSGVMLADYLAYYIEGAHLLAWLGRYEEATACALRVCGVQFLKDATVAPVHAAFRRVDNDSHDLELGAFYAPAEERHLATVLLSHGVVLGALLAVLTRGADALQAFPPAAIALVPDVRPLLEAASAWRRDDLGEALQQRVIVDSLCGGYVQLVHDSWRRHVILDTARVYDVISLKDLAAATGPKAPGEEDLVRRELRRLQQEGLLHSRIELHNEELVVRLRAVEACQRPPQHGAAAVATREVLYDRVQGLKGLLDNLHAAQRDMVQWEARAGDYKKLKFS